MTALASVEDVATLMGRSLSETDEARAEELLVLASQRVLDITGRQFTPGDFTHDRVPDSRGRVSIAGPAESTVTEVREVDEYTGAETTLTLTTDYTVRGRRIYGLRGRCRVAVDFTIPEEYAVPEDIEGVTAAIVAGTLAGPPVGASEQSAGPFRVSYVDSTGRVFLTKTDRAILAKYTDPAPAVVLL